MSLSAASAVFMRELGLESADLPLVPVSAPAPDEEGVDLAWDVDRMFDGEGTSDALQTFLPGGPGVPMRSVDIFMAVIPSIQPLASIAGASLVQLSLCYCAIKNLDGIEHLPSLRRIWLSHNELTSVAPLSRLPHLQRAYLSDNHLRDLTGLRSNTLECLDVSGNLLTSTPLELEALPTLHSLDLSRNRSITHITHLPPNLVHFNASGTGLTTFPPLLKRLPTLRSLSLADVPSGGPVPVARLVNYRATAVTALPGLRYLDGQRVSEQERQEAQAAWDKKTVYYDVRARARRALATKKIAELMREGARGGAAVVEANTKATELVRTAAAATAADATELETAARYVLLTPEPLLPNPPTPPPATSLLSLVHSRAPAPITITAAWSVNHEGVAQAFSGAIGRLIRRETARDSGVRLWPPPSVPQAVAFARVEGAKDAVQATTMLDREVICRANLCPVRGESGVAGALAVAVIIGGAVREGTPEAAHAQVIIRSGKFGTEYVVRDPTRVKPVAVIYYKDETTADTTTPVPAPAPQPTTQISLGASTLTYSTCPHDLTSLADVADTLTTLHLGRVLDPSDIATLPRLPHLTTLSATGDLGGVHVPLASLPALTFLDFSGSTVTADGIARLTAAAAPNLSTIRLENCELAAELAAMCACGQTKFTSASVLDGVLADEVVSAPAATATAVRAASTSVFAISDCGTKLTRLPAPITTCRDPRFEAHLGQRAGGGMEAALLGVSGCGVRHSTVMRLSCLDISALADLPSAPKIRRLELSRCGLTDGSPILPHILRVYPSLDEIVLSHNQLTARGVQTLLSAGGRGLRVIDLSWNKIESLDTQDFAGCTNLSILDISGNQLHNACFNSQYMPHLTEFIAFCTPIFAADTPAAEEQLLALTRLPSLVVVCAPLAPTLRHLLVHRAPNVLLINATSVTQNDRRAAASAVSGRLETDTLLSLGSAETLEEIILENRGLTSLHGLNTLAARPNTFKLLRRLSIANNNISTLTLPPLPLTFLDLSSNPLTLATLPPLPTLRVLRLDATAITNSDLAVVSERCPALEALALRGTAVTDLAGLRLPQLQVLDVSGCALRSTSAPQCPQLTTVVAKGCGIKNLTGFEELTSLRELDITSNQLAVPQAVVTGLEKMHLTSLSIAGNPVARRRGMAAAVIAALPTLENLDGTPITAAAASAARAAHAGASELNPVTGEPVVALKPAMVNLSL